LPIKVNEFVKWNYIYGKTYRDLIQVGMPEEEFYKQKAVKERPEEPHPILEQPYIEAFYTLSGSRPISMGGISKILISEILHYGSVFHSYEIEDFLRLILDVDETYVQLWYDDPKNKPPDPKGNIK